MHKLAFRTKLKWFSIKSKACWSVTDCWLPAAGSVDNYTNQCLYAILQLENEYVQWPNAAERLQTKRRIGANSFFKDCVGFVNGTGHWSLWPRRLQSIKRTIGLGIPYTYALISLLICDNQHSLIGTCIPTVLSRVCSIRIGLLCSQRGNTYSPTPVIPHLKTECLLWRGFTSILSHRHNPTSTTPLPSSASLRNTEMVCWKGDLDHWKKWDWSYQMIKAPSMMCLGRRLCCVAQLLNCWEVGRKFGVGWLWQCDTRRAAFWTSREV